MLGTMTKENTEFVQKSMKMDVMELKLYSVNNISMHYPESWVEYEGVTCYFKSCLNVRPCSSNGKPWNLDFRSAEFGLQEHSVYALSLLTQSCIEEGYSKDCKNR